jgi:PAS domain S-box-containing protein
MSGGVVNLIRRRSIKTQITLLTLFIFFLGIWSLSYYVSQILRQDFQALLGDQQLSTVKLIAAEINQELDVRTSVLEMAAANINQAKLGNAVAINKFLDEQLSQRILFNGGLVAFNLAGVAVAESPRLSGRIGRNFMARDYLMGAIQAGRSTIGQPIMGEAYKAPIFVMAVPIRNEKGQVIGALAGVTNLALSNFLDRMIESPYGRTGNYFIVDLAHRTIVTSSRKSSIMMPLPGPGVIPAIDQLMARDEGVATYLDQYGVEVLSSSKKIPGASWIVSASIGSLEAFSPIDGMLHRVLLLAAGLTILAGGLTYWMLRRQLAPTLDAVKRLSHQVENNERLEPLPVVRQDEIGQLISSFNRLLVSSAQRENELKASELNLAAILDSVEARIYLKDVQGRYLFANKTLCELFGVPAAQIIGQTDEAFFDAETVAELRRNDRQVFVTGRRLKVEEVTLSLKDAFASTQLSIKLPLRNDAGDVYALCGISTDITEHKQSEAVLKRSELDWKEANAGKTAFLTQMSHELRTPLDTILGNAQLLDRPNGQAFWPEGLSNIQKSGWHLLAMIDEILDYARGASGKLLLEPELLNWPEFLKSIESNARVLALVNGNEFQLVIRGDVVQAVVVDERRLRQVLDNLLANAARHTRNGQICLTCTSQQSLGGRLRLDFSVQDSGEGVLLADRERIFLPFERGSRIGASAGKGVGMGLAISRQLIETMGGALTLSADTGQGACFQFWLTVDPGFVSQAAMPTQKNRRRYIGYFGPIRTILVVDDDASSRYVLTSVLRECGFDVLEAASGQAAAQILAGDTIVDMVLTDQFMPDGDGWLVLAEANQRTPIVPVVLMSAAPPKRPVLFSERLNFEASFLKPLDHAVLLESMGSLLDLQWIRDTRPVKSSLPLVPVNDADERAWSLNQADAQALQQMIQEGRVSDILMFAKDLPARMPGSADFACQLNMAARTLDVVTLKAMAGMVS